MTFFKVVSILLVKAVYFFSPLPLSTGRLAVTFLKLAASRLLVYRAVDISRPTLQIPITSFSNVAITFQTLPMILRYRRILLLKRRHGILT